MDDTTLPPLPVPVTRRPGVSHADQLATLEWETGLRIHVVPTPPGVAAIRVDWDNRLAFVSRSDWRQHPGDVAARLLSAVMLPPVPHSDQLAALEAQTGLRVTIVASTDAAPDPIDWGERVAFIDGHEWEERPGEVACMLLSQVAAHKCQPVNARVAENARRLTGRAGGTLDQLATATGRSRRVMARRMSGAGRWTVDDVYNVAVALGVEPHTLVA